MKRFPLVVIQLEINSCIECPKVKVSRTPGAGSADDYFCTKNHRMVMAYVEWSSDVKPVPDWCPLRVDKKD